MDSTRPFPVLRARLVEREDLTSDLAIFRFRSLDPIPPYRAGQWTQLGLPDAAAGGEVVWRPYTLASVADGDQLVFYVRRVWKPAPGRMTSLLWALHAGDEASWRRPRGHFTLEAWRAEQPPRTLVLLAGGTGLAPFVAHLEELWRDGAPAPVLLCHAASYVDELGFRERFERLAAEQVDGAGRPWRFRYTPSISRPEHARNSTWRGLRGRIEAQLARPAPNEPSPLERAWSIELTPARVHVLVCGYLRSIDNVLAELHPRGFVGPRPRPDGSLDVRIDSFGDDRTATGDP